MGSNSLWDDPEWEDLRRRVNKQPLPKKKAKTGKHKHLQQKPLLQPQNAPDEPKKVEVSVNVTLPKLSLPKFKLPEITQKQRKIGLIIGVASATIIAGIVVVSVIKGPATPEGGTTNGTQQPPFKTVLPDGKNDTTEGEIRYDPEKQVVSYRDTIGYATVTISQQELPPNFRENPDQEVKKVAEGFSANEILREAHPRIYLGNDVKGPQTVIFHRDGLLIFMLSNRQLEKHEWVEYILKLKQT